MNFVIKKNSASSVFELGPLEIPEILPPMRLESWQVQTDLKRHMILLRRLIGSLMLACIMIMNGNNYDQSPCLVRKLARILSVSTCTKVCSMGHGKCKQLWLYRCVGDVGKGRGHKEECRSAI